MTMISIGDMAQSYALRTQNTAVKERMLRLTAELASGQTTDVSGHLKGDFSYLSDIERSLTLLSGYDISTNEAGAYTAAMQDALDAVQSSTGDLANSLIATASAANKTGNQLSASEATSRFTGLITSLNADLAGRALFSGTATDGAALAPADQILTSLRASVAGATSVQDVVDAISQWFDTPGGGFETTGYLGSTTALSPFAIGDGQSVNLDLKADDPALRAALKFTAIAALATDPTVGLSVQEQSDLHHIAAEGLLAAQDKVINIRADLGFAEARIDEAKARVQSEKTGFEFARGQLLAVDPYETATRLEDVQFQLESLYAVTVRLSRLSLVDYMK